MIKAFQDNIDIHCLTASEIFQISPDSVTKEQRSKAKAINFGLIYGQTSFGLSEALKISQAEAKKYITFYFNRFSQVKVFLDSLKELAEKNGYSETLFGRKRILNGIRSQNRIQKSLAERMAINTPIQGTAADLIKIAMLNIAQEINEKKLSSKIILQIHDELIFELPPEESEELEKIVKYHMENVINLRVPLKVEMGTGRSWYEI